MDKEIEDLDLDGLEEFDDSEEILRGLDEPKYRRRRRAGATTGAASSIVTSPSTLTTTTAAIVGTVVGTAAVVGGSGAYTFTLTDPTGHFTIVGNQIQTIAPLATGTYAITINATNGLGDNPTLLTSVFVTPGVYVPTYPYYGF